MTHLEQLKSVLCDKTGKCSIAGSDEDRAIVDRALQALEAPVQEPVAWMDASGDIYKHELWPNWNPPHTALYTTPPAQPAPVAWLSTDGIGERYLCFDKPLDNDTVQPLFTTPPAAQRQWVDLSRKDEQEIKSHCTTIACVLKAVKYKLKEKNT